MTQDLWWSNELKLTIEKNFQKDGRKYTSFKLLLNRTTFVQRLIESKDLSFPFASKWAPTNHLIDLAK